MNYSGSSNIPSEPVADSSPPPPPPRDDPPEFHNLPRDHVYFGISPPDNSNLDDHEVWWFYAINSISPDPPHGYPNPTILAGVQRSWFNSRSHYVWDRYPNVTDPGLRWWGGLKATEPSEPRPALPTDLANAYGQYPAASRVRYNNKWQFYAIDSWKAQHLLSGNVIVHVYSYRWVDHETHYPRMDNQFHSTGYLSFWPGNRTTGQIDANYLGLY